MLSVRLAQIVFELLAKASAAQLKLLLLSGRWSRLQSRLAPAVRRGAWKNGRLLSVRLGERLLNGGLWSGRVESWETGG